MQPTASSHVNKYNPLGNELGNVSRVIKVYTFNSVIIRCNLQRKWLINDERLEDNQGSSGLLANAVLLSTRAWMSSGCFRGRLSALLRHTSPGPAIQNQETGWAVLRGRQGRLQRHQPRYWSIYGPRLGGVKRREFTLCSQTPSSQRPHLRAVGPWARDSTPLSIICKARPRMPVPWSGWDG